MDDNSLDSIMCDPPFLYRRTEKNPCKMITRFGCYKSIDELYNTQTELLNMCYGKLKQGGILIYKIQDTKTSYGQIWTHQYIMNEAERIGYQIEDIFIKVLKNVLPVNGKQKCARKNHSYFIILRKK